MKIDVALRVRPYSHVPGASCYLPGSSLLCVVYPTRLEIWSDHCLAVLEFHYFGLLKQFTVTADLEAFAVIVSGFAEKGYFRYTLRALETGFVCEFVKKPQDLDVAVSHLEYQLEKVENRYTFSQSSQKQVKIPERERLSLGCSKSQDVEMIFRRQDIREIVPLWYFYAQSVHAEDATYSSHYDAMTMQKMLQDISCAGFKSIFVPQIADEQYQGFHHPIKGIASSRHALLKNSHAFLRSIFFQEDDTILSILPCVPPQFHAGRLTHVRTRKNHLLHLEWTKKCMRRAILLPHVDDEIVMRFPSSIRSFRVRMGSYVAEHRSQDRLVVKKGVSVLFDNFKK